MPERSLLYAYVLLFNFELLFHFYQTTRLSTKRKKDVMLELHINLATMFVKGVHTAW